MNATYLVVLMEKVRAIDKQIKLVGMQVQVVVMSANMGCSHCRQRVANVVSKMNGLLDYMVDFGKKEVTVRGKVAHTKKRRKHKNPFAAGWETKSSASPGHGRTTLSWFLGCYAS